jgi:hypothetical protein
LTLGTLSLAALAGCNTVDLDEEPDEPQDGSQGSDDLSEGRDSVLDIRDFGAEVDGTTDDTRAVRNAIKAASSGETVFFPGGTTLVSIGGNDNQAVIDLHGDDVPDDLTIRGTGEESVVRMDGGHKGHHRIFYFEVESGYEGLVIRDLRLDGNKEEQLSELGTGGHGFLSFKADSASVPVDVLIENVWIENFNQSGITPHHGGFVINRCTVRNCTKHGIAPDTWHDVHKYDPPIEIRNCYLTKNGKGPGAPTYGIDVSGGKILVEDCVCEDNAQGTKTTGQVIEATYRRVRLKDNDINGYQRPSTSKETDERENVIFEDVISEDNRNYGFRLGSETDYTVPAGAKLIANRNSAPLGNIYITHDAVLVADSVWSTCAINGYGLFSDRNSLPLIPIS